MPDSLRRYFQAQVVATDASLVVVTRNSFQLLTQALPLVLAATDPDCRIVCEPVVAKQLLKTKMICPSKIVILEGSGSLDLGYAKVSIVTASHFKATPRRGRRKADSSTTGSSLTSKSAGSSAQSV